MNHNVRALMTGRRTARELPADWRLWSAALAVAGIGQVSVLTATLLAAGGLFYVWFILSTDASGYLRSLHGDHRNPVRRRFAFLARTTIAAGFLTVLIRLLGLLLGEGAHRLPVLFAILAVLGMVLAVMAFQQTWKLGYGLGAGVIMTGAAALSFLAERTETPHAGITAELWFRGIIQTLILFAAARLFAGLMSRGPDQRIVRWTGGLVASIPVAFISGMAIVPPGSLLHEGTSGTDRMLWFGAVLGLAIISLVNLARGRVAIAGDLRYLRFLRRPHRWKYERHGTGVFLAFAAMPVMGMMPIGGWACWGISFGLFALGGLFKLLADGPGLSSLLRFRRRSSLGLVNAPDGMARVMPPASLADEPEHAHQPRKRLEDSHPVPVAGKPTPPKADFAPTR
jgi:hypothetical protein